MAQKNKNNEIDEDKFLITISRRSKPHYKYVGREWQYDVYLNTWFIYQVYEFSDVIKRRLLNEVRCEPIKII